MLMDSMENFVRALQGWLTSASQGLGSWLGGIESASGFGEASLSCLVLGVGGLDD